MGHPVAHPRDDLGIRSQPARLEHAYNPAHRNRLTWAVIVFLLVGRRWASADPESDNRRAASAASERQWCTVAAASLGRTAARLHIVDVGFVASQVYWIQEPLDRPCETFGQRHGRTKRRRALELRGVAP